MSRTIAEPTYLQAGDNCHLGHLPGEYGLPVIGKTFSLVRDFYGTIDAHYRKYGPISRIGLAGVKGVLVLGPEFYREIYLNNDDAYSSRMGYRNSLGHFYPDNVLLRDGADHRTMRRMMQSAFKTPAMRGYVGMMNPIIARSMPDWDRQPDFHFVPAIKRSLLDVAASVFFGIDELGDTAAKLNRCFIDMADGMTALVRYDIALPWLKYRKAKVAQRYVERFFDSLVDERRGSDAGDMLTYLCNERDDEGNYYARPDIVHNADFLMFAAHDTTTSALSHLLYEIGQRPEWQERLRDEVMSIDKEVPDYDDLDRLVDLERAFKEALRLHPSVMLMQRRTTKEVELGGFRIPANTQLLVTPMYTHLMAKWWSNPTEFDPDRFSDGRAEHKRHPFNYMAFGGGAHKCIGMHFGIMQGKCFMYQFLRRYRFRLADNFDPALASVPLPKPADDLPLVLEPLQ